MKFTSVIISIILASSTLGYGIASADTGAMAGSGGGTPCTASYPCTKICGDHPCAPGEVYTAGSQSNATKTTTVSTTSTTKASASTNSTGTPSMQTQLGISASANVTKTTNSTAMQTGVNGTSMQTQMNISANATATKMTNGTMVTSNNTGTMLPPPVTTIPSPEKQVSSGVAPSAVKCQSGYQLVLNKFDSRPACVSPEVMAKLVARGWASASS